MWILTATQTSTKTKDAKMNKKNETENKQLNFIITHLK